MEAIDAMEAWRSRKDKRRQEALSVAMKNAEAFPDQASFETFIKDYERTGIPSLSVPGAKTAPPVAGGDWIDEPPAAPKPDLAGKMAESDAMARFVGGEAPIAPAADLPAKMDQSNAAVRFMTGEPPAAPPVPATPAVTMPVAPPEAQRLRLGGPETVYKNRNDPNTWSAPLPRGAKVEFVDGPAPVGTPSGKSYTPEQMAALESGDPATMAAAWPNGVPADAFNHATQWQTSKEARAAREALAQETREARKRDAETRRDSQKEKQTEDRVTKFSKAVDDLGIPEAMVVFNNIKKYVPQEGDIPGFGRAGGTISQWLTSQEGLAARQAVAALKNIKIKDRSGAAVTPQEFERLDQEVGAGKFKTEAELRRGIQQALETYKARLKNTYGGVDPAVRARFYENQGVDDYLTTFEGMDFNGKAVSYDADVIGYAEKHGISPAQALTIKQSRSGAQ